MLQMAKNSDGKKGISPMIAYIILISIAIVMGAFIYPWLKSYVPQEPRDCPDGTSLFVKSYTYDCPAKKLTINIENNGRFSALGFFIYGATTSLQVATENLSQYYACVEGDTCISNVILFGSPIIGENPFSPNQEKEFIFETQGSRILPDALSSIEIIPVRSQKYREVYTPVSCGNSKIKQDIECS